MSNTSFRLCAGQHCSWVLVSVPSPFLCNTASSCISWHLNAEAPCAIFACSLSAKLPARAVLQASSVVFEDVGLRVKAALRGSEHRVLVSVSVWLLLTASPLGSGLVVLTCFPS